MKNIIKKISVLGLCIGITINMNGITYASVLDAITNEPDFTEVQVQENKNTEEVNNTTTENKDAAVSTLNSTAKSSSFSDISNHWAKNWIEEAVKLGFVSGYEDGTFKPDRTVTRAEFSKLLNSALHTENKADLTFTDVKKADWFYAEVQKSVASGFFSGYENNTFKPNNPIKREEVAKPMFTNKDDSEVKKPVQRKTTKVGRNDPCPCGSGKKYKNCCGKNA
ncbi:hypothetical protein SDC9_117837 [bioreactor metagenome]|uniref:SLH domain-containing protein n=1 Tax=bioreactor metagenome TaxID=1076179 RepID=A0A645BZA0_9ZZZZ